MKHRSALVLRLLAGISGAVAGLLLVRLIARVLLGNPANPTVRTILSWTRPLLFPWSGLWPPSELPMVELERATLLSLLTYFVAGILLGLAARRIERPRRNAQEE